VGVNLPRLRREIHRDCAGIAQRLCRDRDLPVRRVLHCGALFKVLTAAQRARVLSYGQGAQHRLLGAYHSRAWPQQWAVDRGHPAPRPRPRLRTLLGFATAGGRGRESRPRHAEIAGPAGPCGEATEPTEAGGPAAFVPRAWPAPQCRPRSNLHWQIHRERHRVPVVLTGRNVVKSKYT
jgi:hypothetical protein